MENETFWISFISIVSGIIIISIKYCLKSKCDSIQCFCLKIHRNTEQEIPEVGSPTNNRSRDILYTV
jgi:hypothetical protein